MNTELSLLSLEKSSVYFLGIGGSGMYGVASLAMDMGIRVVGCDEKEGKNTARLRARGIPLLQEEEAIPENVGAVVYSLAVPPHASAFVRGACPRALINKTHFYAQI